MDAHWASYLASLESSALDQEDASYYLWPDTPIEDFQREIRDQVGVSDHHPEQPQSRPASIIRFIKALRTRDLLPVDLSIIDVCCGDAIVLWQIKRAYPEARCFGADILAGKIGTHRLVQRDGVRLFKVYIQHLFRNDPAEPCDLVLMLNTYRGWPAASLREQEQELPRLAHRWLLRNSRYAIVTARESQIQHLLQKGHRLIRLGPGEESSTMICISDDRLPLSSLLRHGYLLLKRKIRARSSVLSKAFARTQNPPESSR